MKKNILSIIFSFVILLTISSCKKNDNVVKTNDIYVELNENESYSYNIPPAGDDGDKMTISKQAMHYTTSTISRQNGNITLFEYTPELDFTGSDEVIIKLEEAGKNGSHQGKCKKEDHDETYYHFKINIKAAHR